MVGISGGTDSGTIDVGWDAKTITEAINQRIAQPRIVCTEILLKAVDAHRGRQVQRGVGSRSQSDTCGAHAPACRNLNRHGCSYMVCGYTCRCHCSRNSNFCLWVAAWHEMAPAMPNGPMERWHGWHPSPDPNCSHAMAA